MESSRAGGAYKMRSDTRYALEEKSDAWRARLTTWLIDQREQGVEVPMITGEIVDLIDRQPRLPAHERTYRLLRFIATQVTTVGEDIIVQQDSPVGHAACAWSESSDWDEVLYFLKYLLAAGWLEGTSFLGGYFEGTITIAGYSRIEVQTTSTDSSQAFVAMWFDKSMDEAYEAAIEPAIREAGYKALRIDQVEHIHKIDDRIIAEMRRSRFVVADFTHGPDGNRGSVYYEAGFAHGFDIPVIFTCKDEEDKQKKSKLAFDTQQYNHIMWKTTDELRERLKDRIEAVIGEGPGKGRSN